MPDAESRAARNRITANPASDSAPEGSRPPDRSAAEGDPPLTSRSVSIPRGQSLALRPGNALVTRGLQDIAQFGNRARAKELVNLSTACWHKDEYDQSIEYLTEAIRLDPQYAKARHERGASYLLARDYARAIADYTEAIRLHPNDEIAYHRRGDAYLKIGDYARAIADYTEAIRLHPNDEIAYHRRGDAYLKIGDYARVIANYTEAIRLHPNDEIAYHSRGNAHFEIGDYDRAIADFSEAIRLDPKYVIAYHNRGNAYLKKGDHAKAESDFAEAKRLGYEPCEFDWETIVDDAFAPKRQTHPANEGG